MLIKYKAALQSEGRRWRKSINELTKSKLMGLTPGPINYFAVSTQQVAQGGVHPAGVTLTQGRWKVGDKTRKKKSCVWLWLGDSEDKSICGCCVTSHLQFLTPQLLLGFQLWWQTPSRKRHLEFLRHQNNARRRITTLPYSRNSLKLLMVLQTGPWFCLTESTQPWQCLSRVSWDRGGKRVQISVPMKSSSYKNGFPFHCLESSKALSEGGKGF